MKHPFSYDDIEAGRCAFLPNNLYSVDAMLQAVWDSAVKRGDVRHCYGYSYHSVSNKANWVADTLITKENYENDGDIDFACAIIKLPEEK